MRLFIPLIAVLALSFSTTFAQLGAAGSATPLSAYEAQYRTHSNLEFTSFDNNNQRMISVRAVQVIFPSGEVIWSTAHFRLATLASIRKQISDAKELLDKLREEATK